MARTPRIHPAYRSYSPLFLVMFPSLPTHSSLLPSVVTRSGTGVRKGVKHDECERHASPRKVERLTSRPKRQTCRSLPIPLVHPPERRSEGGRWTRRMGKERPLISFSFSSCRETARRAPAPRVTTREEKDMRCGRDGDVARRHDERRRPSRPTPPHHSLLLPFGPCLGGAAPKETTRCRTRWRRIE